MHSKTKAQELQATRKAMKEQQMMARQIENEEKKKVSSFVIQKIFFFSVLSNVAITGKIFGKMIKEIYIAHISDGAILLVYIGHGLLPLKYFFCLK